MGAGNVNRDNLDAALDLLVVAICQGFEERRRAIESGSYGKRTLMEYEYINRRVAEAAREIVGFDYDIYINEIGNKIGYAKSEVCDVCETEYKRLKKEVKLNVARRLHLFD